MLKAIAAFIPGSRTREPDMTPLPSGIGSYVKSIGPWPTLDAIINSASASLRYNVMVTLIDSQVVPAKRILES